METHQFHLSKFVTTLHSPETNLGMNTKYLAISYVNIEEKDFIRKTLSDIDCPNFYCRRKIAPKNTLTFNIFEKVPHRSGNNIEKHFPFVNIL